MPIRSALPAAPTDAHWLSLQERASQRAEELGLFDPDAAHPLAQLGVLDSSQYLSGWLKGVQDAWQVTAPRA